MCVNALGPPHNDCNTGTIVFPLNKCSCTHFYLHFSQSCWLWFGASIKSHNLYLIEAWTQITSFACIFYFILYFIETRSSPSNSSNRIKYNKRKNRKKNNFLNKIVYIKIPLYVMYVYCVRFWHQMKKK